MKPIDRIRFVIGLPFALLAVGLLALSYVIMGDKAEKRMGSLLDYMSSWSP